MKLTFLLRSDGPACANSNRLLQGRPGFICSAAAGQSRRHVPRASSLKRESTFADHAGTHPFYARSLQPPHAAGACRIWRGALNFIEETPWDPSPDHLRAQSRRNGSRLSRGQHIAGVAASRRSASFSRRQSPPAPALIPGDVFARAEVRRLIGWFDVKFYAEVSEPLITETRDPPFLPRENGGGGPDMGRVRQAAQRLREHLAYIGHLADHRTWLAGEAPVAGRSRRGGPCLGGRLFRRCSVV